MFRNPSDTQSTTPVYTDVNDMHIPGLQLLHDFVTPDEEALLLQCIDNHAWDEVNRRRIQQYGHVFDFVVGVIGVIGVVVRCVGVRCVYL